MTTVRTHGRLAVVLLAIGVLAWIGHVLLSGRGDHAWDRHPTPPASVTLTAGTSYLVSTVDGPGAASDGSTLACSYRPAGTPAGTADRPLTVTPVAVSSRATHAVGSFVAPTSGAVAVSCRGGVVGQRAVFVDDADDRGSDLAGWALVLAVAALTGGVGAGLGTLCRRGTTTDHTADSTADGTPDPTTGPTTGPAEATAGSPGPA